MVELFPRVNLAVYYVAVCLFIGHAIRSPLYASGGSPVQLEDSFATPQKALSDLLVAFWIPPIYHYVVYAVINFCIMMVIPNYTAGLTTARRNIFLLVLIANPFGAIATLDADLASISTNLLVLSILQVADPFANHFREELPSHEEAVLRRATGYLVYILAAILQPSLLYLSPLYLLISRTQQLRCRAPSGDDKKTASQGRPLAYLTTLGGLAAFMAYWFVYYRSRTGQVRPLCNSIWQSTSVKEEYSIWYKYYAKLRQLILLHTHYALNIDWIIVLITVPLSVYYASVRLYNKAMGTSGKQSARAVYYLNVALQISIIAYALSNLRLSTATLYAILALFCTSTNDLFSMLMSSVGLLGDAFLFSSTQLAKQYAHILGFSDLLDECLGLILRLSTIPVKEAPLEGELSSLSLVEQTGLQLSADVRPASIGLVGGQTSADDVMKASALLQQVKSLRPDVSIYQITAITIIFAVFITYLSGVRLLSKRKQEYHTKKSAISVIVFGSIYLALAIAGAILAHLSILFGTRGLKIAFFVMELIIEPFRMGYLFVLALGSFLRSKRYLAAQTTDTQ